MIIEGFAPFGSSLTYSSLTGTLALWILST